MMVGEKETVAAAMDGLSGFKVERFCACHPVLCLQEARRQAEAEERARDAAASAAEQAAALASPWLNEAPQTTVSALDPHRWRPDHFKGLTPEQRAAILATQAEQVQAKCVAQATAAALSTALTLRNLRAPS